MYYNNFNCFSTCYSLRAKRKHKKIKQDFALRHASTEYQASAHFCFITTRVPPCSR